MNCANCGASAFDRMLHRVNPVGQNGIRWCMPCIEEHELELSNNIKEDMTQAERDIEEICLKPNLDEIQKSN